MGSLLRRKRPGHVKPATRKIELNSANIRRAPSVPSYIGFAGDGYARRMAPDKDRKQPREEARARRARPAARGAQRKSAQRLQGVIEAVIESAEPHSLEATFSRDGQPPREDRAG
jgi:hypothetical protein